MFYQSIADVYDYIFPQNKMQLTFLSNIIDFKLEDKVLDIGCATGNLTDLLSNHCQVTGLDLDQDLLKKAKEKYTHRFIHKNMLEINDLGPFDHIVSFGNTLVHLPDRNSVEYFFQTVHKSLSPGGSFTIQIINYDRIVNQKINHLPTIDNETIKFVRDYDIHPLSVDFKTQLTIKSTMQIIENSIPLLTLGKAELETYLKEAGFKNIQFYGGLNRKALEDHDIPLLFTCKK